MSGIQNNEDRLPAVHEADWLSLVFHDVVDPEHTERWKRFARSEPEFARELAIHAYHEANGNLSATRAAIGTALWTIETIQNSLARQQEAQLELSRATNVVDDGDVIQPL